MVCSQCGAGLTPPMVKSGACGFCGTAVEGVAQAHMEEHVDTRVQKAEHKLRQDLRQDLRREMKEELDDREPSVVTVAAAEAGRYTAAKVWGCGAGCLSTIGSLLMFIVILGLSAGPALYQTWVENRQHKAPKVEKPKPAKPAHPKPKPKKKRKR